MQAPFMLNVQAPFMLNVQAPFMLNVQAPFTPLLTLLHQLLEEQGCSNPQPPFSQMPDDAAHIEVLQRANFTNVKVSAMF